MRSLSMCTGTLLLVVLASGCASVQTGEEWSRLKTNVQERTGYELIWEQSEREEKVVREEVEKLLANYEAITKPARLVPSLANALVHNRLFRGLAENALGLSKDRHLPHFPKESFADWFQENKG